MLALFQKWFLGPIFGAYVDQPSWKKRLLLYLAAACSRQSFYATFAVISHAVIKPSLCR